MPIFRSILNWYIDKRLKQIDVFRTNPVEVQENSLKKLIRKASNTEWGRRYDYKSIKSIKTFKERVPLQDYDSLKVEIQKMLDGKHNVLWPSKVKWFAKSSGTTSDKSKYIPITQESLDHCHYRGAKDVLAIYAMHNLKSKLLLGKGLIIGGSHKINSLKNDSYCGDLSAVLMQNMAYWGHYFRTPKLDIALMDEWDAKLEKMAQATIKENVTSISGVPSWTLVLINRIFEITGKDNLADVWPNLELFIHGGVSFVPYREKFSQIIRSPKMHYMETYNASEGFFGIQDSQETDDMLLMLDYDIFFEFIPMEEFDKENSRTVQLEDVIPGKNYALVFSSNCGLWRYIIGDTIQFTQKYPFKFKITGRTKFFINAFGEEVIVDNAEKALRAACMATGAEIQEYTAAPIYMGSEKRGGHQWLIEFIIQPNDIKLFGTILDDTLKSLNSDYEAKRYHNKILDFPTINVMRQGTFYKWLKEKGKLGGQHKVPRLANHREFLEEILLADKTD